MNQFGTFYEKLVTVTADTTLSAGSADLLLVNPAAATTITLPTPIGNYSNIAFNPSMAGPFHITYTGTAGIPVTIAAAAGSIVGQTQLTQTGQSVTCVSDGVGTWYVLQNMQNSFQVQKSLSAADILGMNATPVTVVPAQGAGKIVVVESMVLKMVRTATAFANGGAVEYRYTNGSGAKVTADMSASLITGAAGTAYASCAGVTTELTPVANAAVVITNATAAFITGTGTGVVTCKFRVVTP